MDLYVPKGKGPFPGNYFHSWWRLVQRQSLQLKAVGGEIGGTSTFVGWITLTHTQRYHAQHGTTCHGHIYQGQFRSFPIQDDEHFPIVCRYVKRNALTANAVDRAENDRWGSLYNWQGGDSSIELAKWPIRRLPAWVDRVNEAQTAKEL
ncbi:MAG: hypothetical protein P8J33_04485 [Pirellulaceae bacterium]|nr:hypothetical protein [Pirellulaceae bacterium]